MGIKPTDAEHEQRVSAIHEHLLNGWSRPAIIRYCSDTWQVTSRTADEYIALANEQIRLSAASTREHDFSLAKARLNAMYGRLIKAGDDKTALTVLKATIDLLRLDEPAPTLPLDITDRAAMLGAAMLDAALIGDPAKRGAAMRSLFQIADEEAARRALQDRVNRLENGT